MISALSWIPKGVAKTRPDGSDGGDEGLYSPDDLLEAEGLDGMSEDEDNEESEESEEELDEEGQVARAKTLAAALKHSAPAAQSGIDSAMAALDMEHYDSEGEGGAPTGIFGSGLPGMALHLSSRDDPYLRRGDRHGNRVLDDDDDVEYDDDSEAEDLELKPNDLLLVGARHEDDVSHLEVWVYEEEDERGEPNLYVHHNVMLPAVPLALAWMDCRPSSDTSPGNYMAVGSMSPGIEIWDLDAWDAVQPVATLGGEAVGEEPPTALEASVKERKKTEKEKGKKKKAKLKEGSHKKSVLGLSWSGLVRNALASASADESVKVWDIAQQECDVTLRHHTGKVQAVAFNPSEASVLLSGSFDKTAVVVDLRQPDKAQLRWEVPDEVEALAWNPHQPTQFLVSCQNGEVTAYDARNADSKDPLFRLAAHDRPTCALSFCPAAPGLLCTASTDKKLKLWDIGSGQPSLVASQDPGVGAAFGAGFCRDAPWLVAAGGAKGTIAVWDIRTSATVAKKFGRQLKGGKASATS